MSILANVNHRPRTGEKNMPPKKHSLLLRMPNWLGDCVMALPAVAHLVDALPDADIFLAAREQFRPLLACQPGVAGFLPAPGSGLGRMLRGIAGGRGEARALLGGGTFDAGLLLTYSFSTAFWLWRIGAAARVGYNTDGRRLFLTHPVPFGEAEKPRHCARNYLHLAQCAERVLRGGGSDFPPSEPSGSLPIPRLAVSAESRERARRLLAARGVTGRYALLAPASAYGPVKDWPPAHYRELAKGLNRKHSLPVVVTGAGGQREVCAAIAADQAHAVSVAGETDMAEFAGLVAESALFIGGDSGGAHAAGALGIPALVIFGVTNPARTRPLGEKVLLIGAGEDRDVKLSTPEAREAARLALAAILPERVLEAANRFL